MDAQLSILHETRELLVVNKPADLVCHPTKGDIYSSLISRARLHFGPESHPQLINRLDRETSGVVLISNDPDAARELRAIWESRNVRKSYLAIVHGSVRQNEDVIDAPLGPDKQSKVAIKDCVQADGSPARTRYKVLSRFVRHLGSSGLTEFSLLEVEPETGRKHQIRIHLAHIGHPIVGDKIYGLDEDYYLALVECRLTENQRQQLILPYQALHAASVSFTWRGTDWRFAASPEKWFCEFIETVSGCKSPRSPVNHES